MRPGLLAFSQDSSMIFPVGLLEKRERLLCFFVFCISFENDLNVFCEEGTKATWEMESKNTLSGFKNMLLC